MSKAIDELKDKFYKRPLDYGAFWPLIFPAILDLATRMDEAEKRISALFNLHAVKLPPTGPVKFGPVRNDAKTKPDKGEKSDTRATSPRKDALEGE